jgi:hypothetical protein
MEVLQLPLVLSNPLTVGKQQAVGESKVFRMAAVWVGLVLQKSFKKSSLISCTPISPTPIFEFFSKVHV